ncbi:MAG TPA: DUF4845 domain-containing protein [Gammaproteobacteria bacterium]|nr:DUF4845 domain-containing protein [Gammaproteobacteria bacterium]
MNGERQQGISFVSLMIVFAVCAFFFLTGLKLFPAYNEFFAVQSAMEGLEREENIATMPRKQIWNALYKRFDINSITTPTAEDLYVEYDKETKTRVISIYYEARVPLYGNIDAVMTFDAPIFVPTN